jgi:hypothetical protein
VEPEGAEPVLQLPLGSKIKLHAAGGRGEGREGIGVRCGAGGPGQDGDELSEIDARPKAFSFDLRDVLQRERIGDERFAEERQGEREDRDIFPFRVVLQGCKRRFAAAVHGLSDEEQHTGSGSGSFGQEGNGTKARIDHARGFTPRRDLSQRGLDISRGERFDHGDLAAISDDGGLAGFAGEQGIDHGAGFGDEEDVLAHVPAHLDHDGDRDRRGDGVEGHQLGAAVIEEPGSRTGAGRESGGCR